MYVKPGTSLLVDSGTLGCSVLQPGTVCKDAVRTDAAASLMDQSLCCRDCMLKDSPCGQCTVVLWYVQYCSLVLCVRTL
jgi:hypothetical protein